MNRAEFMARAIIALGTVSDTSTDERALHDTRFHHSPRRCVERAQELWEVYVVAVGATGEDAQPLYTRTL